ncbi:hypothetical protein XELAEV_18046792mg [Xenopus laevis]|uniref:Uncharacterized protein n=1 Tax=Xenopus laevis TaxID=8355 RepID=A0A974H0X8_XENLA|nr:hypothetical protein XELAEV_18046792mg [Xenopus laevis]
MICVSPDNTHVAIEYGRRYLSSANRNLKELCSFKPSSLVLGLDAQLPSAPEQGAPSTKSGTVCVCINSKDWLNDFPCF